MELSNASSLAESLFSEHHDRSARSSSTDPTSHSDPISSLNLKTCGHIHPLPSPLHSSSIPLVYCDTTASGRALELVEDYIYTNVTKWLANTHTTTSSTGGQSTAFVTEARQIISESCNARTKGKAAIDAVIFTGDGATSAVDCLISFLPKGGVLITGPMQVRSCCGCGCCKISHRQE